MAIQSVPSTIVNGKICRSQELTESPPESQIKRPENLNELIRIAEKLSKPFRFVRVDLHNENGIISELTFTPLAGEYILLKIWDLILGKLWQ